MGRMFSNRRSKLIAGLGVFILLCVLMSRCGGGDDGGSGSSTGGNAGNGSDRKPAKQVSCDWAKGSFADRTMYIYTADGVSGTYVDADGKERDAEFVLGRTYDAFFASIEIKDKAWRPAGASAQVSATLTFPASEAGYSQQETFGGRISTDDGGNAMIWFDGKNYIHSALEQYPGTRLDFTVAGSGFSESFGLVLPGGEDYVDIISKTAVAMKIPAYSDKIYDGDGVNPDLVEFFKEFVPVFTAEVEYWAENDGVPGSVMQLLQASPHEDFTRLWAQYEAMNPLPRDVDAEFYAGYAQQINQIVSLRTLKSTWTVVQGCMEAMDKMADAASGW